MGAAWRECCNIVQYWGSGLPLTTWSQRYFDDAELPVAVVQYDSFAVYAVYIYVYLHVFFL